MACRRSSRLSLAVNELQPGKNERHQEARPGNSIVPMKFGSARLDSEWLLAHSVWVRSLARALLGDWASADDIVQDTWLPALERAPRRDARLRVHSRSGSGPAAENILRVPRLLDIESLESWFLTAPRASREVEDDNFVRGHRFPFARRAGA